VLPTSCNLLRFWLLVFCTHHVTLVKLVSSLVATPACDESAGLHCDHCG
jgi:hypothetical protein